MILVQASVILGAAQIGYIVVSLLVTILVVILTEESGGGVTLKGFLGYWLLIALTLPLIIVGVLIAILIGLVSGRRKSSAQEPHEPLATAARSPSDATSEAVPQSRYSDRS